MLVNPLVMSRVRAESRKAFGRRPRRRKKTGPQEKRPNAGSYRGRGASLTVASETISEHRGPLLVIHVGAAIPAEIAFHKIPGTNVPIDHGVNEIGIVIVRQTGIERLMTAQELKSERIGKVLRK